ncbi:MAG: glycoside hydrolase family 5 protein [Candidatus Omnitrophica bacterium]|nr:glycoside hydrolase family 5 protein [Candidatus Omnitrophota bacterium]MDE2230733.1 glycoside hydrolase family 5 protein [Candidatus Omnitrophota bacterium]
MKPGFLKRDKNSIVTADGKPVHLRGVNFGGWLMMEAYFMYSPNWPQQVFEKEFVRRHGPEALQKLLKSFRENFITEADVRQVASWGMNCIRLPFHYKVAADRETLAYLDRAVSWGRKHKVYLILDLHAAYGAQNHDWHSDSMGPAELWTKKSNRHKTYDLWQMLADRYKDEETVAGYDVLNEAVLDDAGLLNEFYSQLIKAIRRSDKNHILFIEGNRWAQQIDVLDDFEDDNWVYSIHFYEPIEFTFNYVPFLKYPWKGCDKDVIRRRMEGYWHFARKRNRPVHVGEFGVNYRQGFYHEHVYLRDELKVFNDLGFHWNYWTYKAVKNYLHPDGIYGYYPNSPWVNRPAVKPGWHTWADCWPKYKHEMAASWRTKAFGLNTHVAGELQKAS